MAEPASPSAGPRRSILPTVLVVIAAILLAGFAAWQMRPGSGNGPELGGAFSLTDQDGRAVTNDTYKGKWRLVYFGYAFCPDVCPTELQTVAEAIEALGPDGAGIVPMFISVDPARDTVARLKDYVGLFHPRMVGLTGTEAQVTDAARKYRVYFARQAGADADSYLMDHSSFTYLMKPDGSLSTVFPAQTDPDTMAAAIRQALSDR
jgi:protein SCO1/2